MVILGTGNFWEGTFISELDIYKLFVVFSKVYKMYVVSRDIFSLNSRFLFTFTTLVVRMSDVALAE